MLVLFMICAFRSGSDRYYLKRAVGIEGDGRDVLYFIRLRKILRLLLFYVCLYCVKLVLLFLSFLPFIASVLLSGAFLYSKGASALAFTVLLIACAVLFVHGTVFFFRFNSFLFVSRYCFVTERFSKIRDLLRFSIVCMQGNRQRIFLKKLSFIPWFFSCVLLLPISFVRSYYNQTMASLAADLIEKRL